jgi:hypothetical protein
MLKCPLDRLIEPRSLAKVPLNYLALQLIDFRRTGVVSRERCTVHEMPVELICKTCDQLCCVKCVRVHKPHDLLDIDHPTFYKDIDDYDTKLASLIESSLGMVEKRSRTLSHQLQALEDGRVASVKSVESIFEMLMKNLQSRKLELISNVNYHSRRTHEEVMKRQEEYAHLRSKLSTLSMTLDKQREAYQADSSIDRTAVFYRQLLNFSLPHVPPVESPFEMKGFCFPEVMPLASMQLRDLVSLKYTSPIQQFTEEFRKQDSELGRVFDRHRRSRDIDKILMEIQSTSAVLVIDTANLDWARWHLMLAISKRTLNEEFDSLPSDTMQKIKSLIGTAACSQQILELIPMKVKERVHQAIAVYHGIKAAQRGNWSEALDTLQWAALKLSEHKWAVYYLNVIILRLCTVAVNMTMQHSIIEVLPFIDLIVRHLLIRPTPSKAVYRQVQAIVVAILEYTEANLPSDFFVFFQSRIMMHLKDLEYVNKVEFEPRISDKMQTELADSDKADYFYWTCEPEFQGKLRDVLLKAAKEWEPWTMQLVEVQHSGAVFSFEKVASIGVRER